MAFATAALGEMALIMNPSDAALTVLIDTIEIKMKNRSVAGFNPVLQ